MTGPGTVKNPKSSGWGDNTIILGGEGSGSSPKRMGGLGGTPTQAGGKAPAGLPQGLPGGQIPAGGAPLGVAGGQPVQQPPMGGKGGGGMAPGPMPSGPQNAAQMSLGDFFRMMAGGR